MLTNAYLIYKKVIHVPWAFHEKKNTVVTVLKFEGRATTGNKGC